MLRENKDVFDLFICKLPEMVIKANSDLIAEFLVHFMFNDLDSGLQNKRVAFISYQIGRMEHSDLEN